jgi:hypothetical protein
MAISRDTGQKENLVHERAKSGAVPLPLPPYPIRRAT